MVLKVLYSILLAFYIETCLYGQKQAVADSTIVFDEVIVISDRLNSFGIGSSVQKLDSLTILHHHNQSLSELLAAETSVSVKSYGPAGLAGISLRGGGTRHTAVLWNGLNLQNPMNAYFNFSTVPVSFIDEISIQHGGSGTLFGSGATTGVIHINNSLKLNQLLSIEAGASAGSFNVFDQTSNVTYGSNSIATSTRFSHRYGKNNFTFINNEKFGRPKDTLKNAAYNGYSFLQQNAFRLSQGSIIRTDLWYQKYAKEIPSLMTDMLQGKDNQTDENIRLSVNSSHTWSHAQIFSRFGLLNDKIMFNNSKSHSLSVIGETEAKYLLSWQHKLGLGINYTFENAYAAGYPDKPQRNKVATFGSYGFSALENNLNTVASFRQEYVNGRFIPFVYSIAAKFDFFRGLFLKSNLSKNYALPTFNDLYWIKSTGVEGNPNLLPESGFSFEGAFGYERLNKHLHFLSELSVYKSEINNWIVWLPNDQGVWKPNNFEKGISKGLEINSGLSFYFSQLSLKWNLIYAYTNAKPLKSGEEKSNYQGKQMIYVPRHKISGNFRISWHTFYFTYQQSYTSQRYTSPEAFLVPYQLGEVSFSKDWIFQNYFVNFFFKIENIWNESYQLTKDCAMPGRSFLCGLNLKFQTK
jgi:vitamin B12 transporter